MIMVLLLLLMMMMMMLMMAFRFDVDLGPLFQTPQEVAKAAVESDVHVVALSFSLFLSLSRS